MSERCPKCGEPLVRHPSFQDVATCQRCAEDFRCSQELGQQARLEHLQRIESERDRLASALRASEARELVLRDALMDYGRHIQSIPELGIVGCDFDPEIGATCTCGLRPALSNTSAAAQQVRSEIEREVRKAVWDKVKDMWGASPMQFRAAIMSKQA